MSLKLETGLVLHPSWVLSSPVCVSGVCPLRHGPNVGWECCNRCPPGLRARGSQDGFESAKRTRPDTQTDPTAPSWREAQIKKEQWPNERRRRMCVSVLLGLVGEPLGEFIESSRVLGFNVASAPQKLWEVRQLLLFHLHLRVQNLYLVSQLGPKVWHTQRDAKGERNTLLYVWSQPLNLTHS